MANLYNYAAMVKNQKEGSRIMGILSDIVENDIVAPNTIKANKEHLSELRELGEILIVESLLHDFPYKFK